MFSDHVAVSKRVLRGYFRRTAFEFHDGESAGTIPYMAPEILKRRPYGEYKTSKYGSQVFDLVKACYATVQKKK